MRWLLLILVLALPARAAEDESIQYLRQTLRENPKQALSIVHTVATMNNAFTSAQVAQFLRDIPPKDRLAALTELAPKMSDATAADQVLALIEDPREKREAEKLLGAVRVRQRARENAVELAPPFSVLTTALAAESSPPARLNVLTRHLQANPTSIDAAQLREVLSTFGFGRNALAPLSLLEPRLQPLKPAALIGLLRSFPEENRLDVLATLRPALAGTPEPRALETVFPSHDAALAARALVADIVPRTPLFGSVTGRRVVFLVDSSSSMGLGPRGGAGSLTRVVQELSGIVADRLPADTAFTIAAFESTLHVWNPAPTSPTAPTRRSAVAFLGGLQARGGTVMQPALAWALGQHPDAVYVLSDGCPSDSITQIYDLVAAAAQRGTTVNAAFFRSPALATRPGSLDRGLGFMQRLAREGHGVLQVIE